MDPARMFTPEYVKQLTQIERDFQDSLNKHLKHEIESDTNAIHLPQFQDVSLGYGQSTIQFRNLEVIPAMAFVNALVRVDLLNQCFDCNIVMCNLHIETDIQVTNRNMDGVTLAENGRMTFKAHDLHITGRVGFYSSGDSLVSLNYDISLYPEQIKTLCVESNSIKKDISFAINNNIMSIFWIEVKEWIIMRFDTLLSDCINKHSVGQIFVVQPEFYKAFEQARISLANSLFEEHLQRYIAICMPTKYKTMDGCFISKKIPVLIDTEECTMGNLKTLKRINHASIARQGESLIAYADVEMMDFQCDFINCALKHLNKDSKEYHANLHMAPNRHRIRIRFELNGTGDDSTCKMMAELMLLEMNSIELEVSLNSVDFFSMHLKDLVAITVGYTRQRLEVILKRFADCFNEMYAGPPSDVASFRSWLNKTSC